MDFLKNVGNMVGKGLDSLKTQINKVQENSSNSYQSNNSLPKGVHILGIDDQSNFQTKNDNLQNTNTTNSNNDYNKFYYSQQNQQNTAQTQSQPQAPKKSNSSKIQIPAIEVP